MGQIYLTADLHLGHSGMITQGWRPFATQEEMNETIIDRWNEVVRLQDKVYVLGDVAMRKKALLNLGRLKGHKVLISGNHDIYPIKDYLVYFKRVYGARPFDDCILTHVPVHPDVLGKRFVGNIHGHLHGGNRVMLIDDNYVDRRYVNMNVELWNYTPISWDEVRKHVEV